MIRLIHRLSLKVKRQSSSEPILPDAPEEYGLLVTLDEKQGARMEMVPDQYFPEIHPHGHGPASLHGLQLLKGGGSGVRVFAGEDPELGSLVMKHGSDKDTKELFALATISRELQQRRTRNKPAADAAQNMQQRIPAFRMIYISPQHLKERPKEFWINFKNRLELRPDFSEHYRQKSDQSNSDPSSNSGETTTATVATTVPSTVGSQSVLLDANTTTTTTSDTILHDSDHNDNSANEYGLAIRLFRSIRPGRKVSIYRTSHAVKVDLGYDTYPSVDRSKYALRYGAPTDGYNCLKAFVDELIQVQKSRNLKFTLAQKTIGGPSPKTAASHLANGRLHGELLETLIEQYIQVIHCLQNLTKPNEVHVIDKIRKELAKAVDDRCILPYKISREADAFVGFAIKKNWHPETGRFFRMRRLGKAFRRGELYLAAEEEIPAKLLGTLLKSGTKMNAVFLNVPARSTALETRGYTIDSWRKLLKDAISLNSPAAQDCLWNCGLSDGGLHNLFLSTDQLLYLFDMGAPELMPLPAFLTKFLFSFFHTLGMVDDKEKGRGWVNRFEMLQNGETIKLTPTHETDQLLPQAYSAFKMTMDRLVRAFFDKKEERAVKKLLVNYVTLQLLSDASFCLDRWRTKGGGYKRNGNHNKYIEEWLWRSLWDIYVASDLNSSERLLELGVKAKPKWTKEKTYKKK